MLTTLTTEATVPPRTTFWESALIPGAFKIVLRSHDAVVTRETYVSKEGKLGKFCRPKQGSETA